MVILKLLKKLEKDTRIEEPKKKRYGKYDLNRDGTFNRKDVTKAAKTMNKWKAKKQ